MSAKCITDWVQNKKGLSVPVFREPKRKEVTDEIKNEFRRWLRVVRSKLKVSEYYDVLKSIEDEICQERRWGLWH